MPKIIKDAKQTILACAREHILVSHEHKLSIRQIARECGIAVGTIYNYFPDKTSLLVAVMVKDWQAMLMKLDEEVVNCHSLQEGLFCVYDTLYDFKHLYGDVFENFSADGGDMRENSSRHVQLRNELQKRVQVVLGRFTDVRDSVICCLLTETIMTCSSQEDLNKEMLWAFVCRIF